MVKMDPGRRQLAAFQGDEGRMNRRQVTEELPGNIGEEWLAQKVSGDKGLEPRPSEDGKHAGVRSNRPDEILPHLPEEPVHPGGWFRWSRSRIVPGKGDDAKRDGVDHTHILAGFRLNASEDRRGRSTNPEEVIPQAVTSVQESRAIRMLITDR